MTDNLPPHLSESEGDNLPDYTLPCFHTYTDDDLILAFEAEIAQPRADQPTKDCAVFEVVYRALVLRADAPFTAFDYQYRRMVIGWLRETPSSDQAVERMDGGIDDMVTDVYMRLFHAFRLLTKARRFYSRFDGRPNRVFAYIQITSRSVVNTILRSPRRIDDELGEDIMHDSYSMDDWLASSAVLERARALLSPEDWEIFRLHSNGYRAPDIALVVKRKPSYIHTRIRSILRRLMADEELSDLLQ
ncbi:MAG: hypothetical protein DYG88_15750 [Chloroflexi bacterium CFX4]|nr:hypothetical protein [Chloroflexi bacterium CFX4]MDL1921811.1 hypothetical protein [Chloroflexi bacterium CFX3]